MVPKKAKEFKKPTAEELGLPENLVNDLIDFYWAKARKNISNLDYEAIEIINLGTFKVKHWLIEDTVEKYKCIIAKIEGKFAEHNVKKELESRMEKLALIKKIVQDRNLKFNEIRDARKSKNNLEEQSSDMEGLSELDSQD